MLDSLFRPKAAHTASEIGFPVVVEADSQSFLH